MADGSLSTRVYDDILGRIVSGRMKPGDLFNRRQVAAELGVSVAPVLEAMLELETEGLIQTLPRRGTRVCLAGAEDVWGQLMVREALECQAARLYCGQPITRHKSRLLRMAEALDGVANQSVQQIRDEIRFHHYLVSLAHCPPLTREFERVMKLGLLHAANQLESRSEGTTRHVALVEALEAADADAAEDLIRAHLRYGKPASVTTSSTGDDGELPAMPSWLGE